MKIIRVHPSDMFLAFGLCDMGYMLTSAFVSKNGLTQCDDRCQVRLSIKYKKRRRLVAGTIFIECVGFHKNREYFDVWFRPNDIEKMKGIIRANLSREFLSMGDS